MGQSGDGVAGRAGPGGVGVAGRAGASRVGENTHELEKFAKKVDKMNTIIGFQLDFITERERHTLCLQASTGHQP